MKLIWVRDNGSVRQITASRSRVLVTIAALCVLVVAGLAAGYLLGTQADLAPQRVAQWQSRLAQHEDRVAELKSDSDAQSVAIGRQLAQMQARLLRMEALGARVTEVADLDPEEFSFAELAPQGGPAANAEILPLGVLSEDVLMLADDLRRTEQEFEILESLLTDRRYRKAVAIAGRPITWGWMSSPFGQRVDPISGKQAWHAGVDFAGREGSDVVAVASGVVTFAGVRSGYGKMVEINHGDGYSTRYGHHKEVVVQAGAIVKKGVVIATMGATGRATGPHVHFEVIKNGRHVNPAKYVAGRK